MTGRRDGPASLVPEDPDGPLVVLDELLEPVEQGQRAMLDLVQNRLEDDDRELGEQGRGEEVHLPAQPPRRNK